MRRRLLAVSHESTLTGAPMNLLHLLRWIRANTDITVHTLLLRHGPLYPQFLEVGPVTALDGPACRALFDAPAERDGIELLGGRTRADHELIRSQVASLTGYDLVYLNSAASAAIVPFLGSNGPRVCHVHEMGVALESMVGEGRRLLRATPDRWFAASPVVRDDLVRGLHIPANDISVHYEFIDARRWADTSFEPREVERLRRSERIPEDAAIVMGAGMLEWRKGPDLFVQLAAEVTRRTREPVRFVWLGGEVKGLEWARLWSQCGLAGVRDVVRFVGTHADPEQWFASADVFVLTSREDPFPLVCLEQAALGHPIVSFRNGGIVDLLRDAGPNAATGIVDHLDVGRMADRTLALLDSDRLRNASGAELRQRVLDHHDVAVAAPALFDELEGLMAR